MSKQDVIEVEGKVVDHFSDYTFLSVNQLMKQSSENRRKEITGELMESPINKS